MAIKITDKQLEYIGYLLEKVFDPRNDLVEEYPVLKNYTLAQALQKISNYGLLAGQANSLIDELKRNNFSMLINIL